VRIARTTLLVFIVFQVADALITFGAVQIFGTAAEGNPILGSWMALVGPAATLATAKTIACGGALVLYSAGRFRTLALLTAGMLVFAIGPWLNVLSALR
jgi:hypothetical protein